MELDTDFWIALGTWFIGFSTLGAVVYAFYLQRTYSESKTPRLVLKLDTFRYLPPTFIRSEPQDPTREELWVRVEVTNAGIVAATDVELRLLALEQRATDLQAPKWWFKAANLDSVSVKALHPRFSQFFDLVYVVHRFAADTPQTAFLVISKDPILPWAQAKQEIETPGGYCELELNTDYRLRVALTSSNAPAIYCSVEFCIPAVTSKSRMAKGVLGKDELVKSVRVSSPVEDALPA